ncbi:MOSC domain-containing protein [Actinomadura sp. HBU206391]|uniref:MOSC domain-containing protein n=1 Tax=Actinomadura sp. HBU206391 TaxID=2731692 RepID=UPI00164F87F9|nr:MOSC N-terminal beta barrel domain-containing protein [Actinomadura sp. HBU206391]MBC6456683.1 MOSC N-terminal beta barrel domain-containing protein [Actinomadura sp. HBU206391]
MARVAELITYPVKGCAGISMTETLVAETGLAHDRSFMVVSEKGVFRSQRRDPRLALIRPEVSADGERLTLTAPGADALVVEVDLVAARRDVDLFGRPFKGIDQGQAAAEWLSDVLGVAGRLVRVPPEHDRVTDGRIPGRCGYADSGSVHLLSQATLDALNRRLAEGGGRPLPMSRFRPNIVIDGWEEPHREDRARDLGIGNAELGYAKLAIRCAVTMVDQRHAVKAGPEPLRTLATYRRASAGGVAFGVKLSVTQPGKLTVGDELKVGSWSESEL